MVGKGAQEVNVGNILKDIIRLFLLFVFENKKKLINKNN